MVPISQECPCLGLNASPVSWKTFPESLSYVFAAFLFDTLEVFRFSCIDSVHCSAGRGGVTIGSTHNLPLGEPITQCDCRGCLTRPLPWSCKNKACKVCSFLSPHAELHLSPSLIFACVGQQLWHFAWTLTLFETLWV